MLTPESLLAAYAQGIFPMAESRDKDRVHWIDPQRRGIFPLYNFHISRSLARKIRRSTFTIRTNTAFSSVVEGCADRQETWINGPLFRLYVSLHQMRRAHSLEVWQGDDLVGGVFGITLGGAFFGESMFSRQTDASKVALAYLVERLDRAGFRLFDAQFLTPHLQGLGAVEISREEYRHLLKSALARTADFEAAAAASPDQVLMQRKTQTS